MAVTGYDLVAILTDLNGKPIPQYYDSIDEEFKPLVEGAVYGAADTDIPAAGVYTGQPFLSIATQRLWIWDGAAWVEVV